METQTKSEPGLMKLYNRLGASENDMNDDINSDILDFVDIHSLTVTSCPPRDSPEEDPHLCFWRGINANWWVTSIIRDGYTLLFVELPISKQPTEISKKLHTLC